MLMRGRLAIVTVAAMLLSLVVPIAASTAQGPPEWPAAFSARLVPVQETGPPSQRLNLIVMCDGYQADEMDQCFEDVDRNQAVQFSVEPFRSYRHYINVYRLEIVSPDSGTRCDPDVLNAFLNTALRLGFAANCPAAALARGVTYLDALVAPRNGSQCPNTWATIGDPRCTGNQQRTLYLENVVAPALGIPANAQNLQTLAVVNTFTYGGIGGTHATATGGSPQGPLISTHELGHSLGSMADEYPYSSRTNPGNPAGNNEPGSFHHTRMTAAEMIAAQAKWFRWLGEESLAGGEICARDCLSGAIGNESGNTNGSNIWRPSSHSMMRWIGFHFDQVGREHMVARITGQRNTGQMPLGNTPVGEVPANSVLWVDPLQPKFHEMRVTWRLGGPEGAVINTGSRNLGVSGLAPGSVVHVEVRDPVGPDGIDWVRNPSTANAATNSGYNGPRFVQTRQWTVGAGTATPTPPGDVDLVVGASPTDRPVGGEEVVYVQTGHPSDRAVTVTWRLNGAIVAGSTDRTINLGALNLPSGTHQLTATVTDPASGGGTETVTWVVDNVMPTAPRTLSEPLTTLDGDVEHNVYFNEFDMLLEPQDDRTGYTDDLYVVGELRLNGDGWFNYFGFPEQPFGTPFNFSHTGKDVKALTYGSLGTGGLSKATFEQSYGPGQPNGPFVPGFGTHKVEHRAIDPAGTIGDVGEFRATVLPGDLAECTETLTGSYVRLRVSEGVVCLDGAHVDGGVSVIEGASLVAKDSTIVGEFNARGAVTVQLFGTTVTGRTHITGTTSDVTAAGNTFRALVVLTDNTQVQANERFAQYGYETGPILVGNSFGENLRCSGSNAPARDFGASNTLVGKAGGDCSGL